MLISMIFGIIQYSGSLYENIQVFGIELPSPPAALKTSLFTIEENQIISVWLKYPDRRIENKDFKIAISLVGQNGKFLAKFVEDFNFGYFRNSTGEGQYYKLGEHAFKNGFIGYLQYETGGTWIPTRAVKLVLRRPLPFSLPLKQIGFFIMGIFVLVTGIATIAKDSGPKDPALG